MLPIKISCKSGIYIVRFVCILNLPLLYGSTDMSYIFFSHNCKNYKIPANVSIALKSHKNICILLLEINKYIRGNVRNLEGGHCSIALQLIRIGVTSQILAFCFWSSSLAKCLQVRDDGTSTWIPTSCLIDLDEAPGWSSLSAAVIWGS